MQQEELYSKIAGGNKKRGFMIKHPLCIATVIYILGILIGLYLSLSIALLLILFVIIAVIIYLMNYPKKYIILLFILYLGIAQVHFLDSNFENNYKMINEDDTYQIKAIIISDVNYRKPITIRRIF